MYVRLKRSLFLLRLKKHHKKSPQNAAFETRTELSGGGLDEVLGSFGDARSSVGRMLCEYPRQSSMAKRISAA